MSSAEVIERDVWLPVINPWSGKRVNVRSIACDRLLHEKAVTELESHFALADARNTPDDYFGGRDG